MPWSASDSSSYVSVAVMWCCDEARSAAWCRSIVKSSAGRWAGSCGKRASTQRRSSRHSVAEVQDPQDIGFAPPFALSRPLRTFCDKDLLDFPEVWAAAGTWHDVFAISPDDLLRVTDATACDLTRT